MIKRIISAIMIFVSISSLSLSAGAVDSLKSDIFSYTVSGNEATITDVDDISGKVIIPSKIEEYPVTAIGNGAFGGTKNITEVYIPDSVTKMGATCFAYSSSIKTVRLSTSVYTIGEGMFNQCTALTGLCIPYGVTSIETNAFASCPNLVAVTIPNSMKKIADNAFVNSPNVTLHCYLSETGVGYTYAKSHNFKTEELITVYVNGEEVVFDQPPITDPIKFRTLVPLRSVLEKMGAEIEWYSDLNYAGIDIDGHRLLVKPNEVYMMVDGKRYDLSSPGIEYNNRILIPIRDVVESVGGTVKWNEFDKIVYIEYSK